MYPARLFHELVVELRRTFTGDTHKHSKLRDRLMTAITATLVVDAIGTGLVYWFERSAKNTDITPVWRSFFWVTAQLLTVSSQMKTPLTTGGRIVDLVLELWAISIVTAVAGSFAAFLQSSSPQSSTSS